MKRNICRNKNIGCCLVMLFSCMMLVTSCASQGVTSLQQENNVSDKANEEPEKDENTWVDITMEGGSGKAHINSPVEVIKSSGRITAKLIWNSKNFDYMLVDGSRYDNENPGGESTFTIPVESLDEPLHVIGDTTAMSKPHEVEYIIYWNRADTDVSDETEDESAEVSDTDYVPLGLPQTGDIQLSYADTFSVKKYGDYSVIHIDDSGNYLLVPKEADIPQDVPEDIIVLKQPLDKTYLVSSGAMDCICSCDCLDMVRFCATEADEWSVDEAREAMQDKRVLYAGKYRAPDYELLLGEGCNFVIENTMIYHEPQVKEKLEELGMPVMVETSSREDHPLGRLEWIKLYGLLFGKEKEAENYFDEQKKIIEPVMQKKRTDVTVAFFCVTGNGVISVRRPGDYVSKMIDLAGGKYIIEKDDEDASKSSTMNMQMEDFYASARDADIIIYNSTVVGEITSIDELIKKNALFADFKAVKNGKVYCTNRDLYQQTTNTARFIEELNDILNGGTNEYSFINKLD